MAKPKIPLDQRFARRREVTAGGCWLWTGRITNSGYGQMTITTPEGARVRSVHRVAYEHYVGPIPDGLVIDHLCRERTCFNPEHLEAVTIRENTLRSPVAVTALNAVKTHCVNGHAYSEENTRTYYGVKGKRRQCITCQRDQTRRWRARNEVSA